jgi:SAM-dependent methyltransferase
MSKSPFHVKKYGSYADYVDHQCSKLNEKLKSPYGEAWLRRHEQAYYKMLKSIVEAMSDEPGYDFRGKTCLCLGARGEVEVQAFIDMGCLAIGIDLNPMPNNYYVVVGDASRIQYPENSFDIVYTNSFDHFLLIDRVLKSVRKVLKPDGRFLLMTGTPDGAKHDEYGSTYWDSEEALEKYLSEAYDFKVTARMDIEKDTKGWFSHVLILNNKK